MGFKCVPQVKGLVRSDGMRRDGKGQSKHRANAAAIINEAFLIADPNDGHPIPYRKSASETYDRTLTKDNKYTGYSTADDVMAAIEREAAAQTVDVQVKDKKTGEAVIRQRPLRSDAVIGVAVIFNPPGAVACHWTPEQNARFFQDSLDVMEQIQCSVRVDKNGKQKNDSKRSQQECHLFRHENIIATAEHRDEGEPEESDGIRTTNWHVIYKPEGEDGKYKGNLIDVYFLSHLCKEYPRMMRDRGWDIDDCDLTDFARFSDKSDPENEEYRAKRKAKIKEGGKSVNAHRKRANRKKAQAKLEEAQEILGQTIEAKQDVDEYAERTRREAEAEAERIVADAESEKAGIETDISNLVQERNHAIQERDKAMGEQRDAEQARDKAAEDAFIVHARVDMAQKNHEILQDEIKKLNEAKAEAEKEIGPTMQAANKAKQERDAAIAGRDKVLQETETARQERDKIREEIRTANEDAETAKRNRDASREEAAVAKREADTVKMERDGAVADRDAARREADELRRTMVDQAKKAAEQEAQGISSRIEAEARQYWKKWLEEKKKQAEDKAKSIIADAEAKAAALVAAAKEVADGDGEYPYLLRWMSSPGHTYTQGKHAGKTLLQVAREDMATSRYLSRLSALERKGLDVGAGNQDQGRTGPEGPA